MRSEKIRVQLDLYPHEARALDRLRDQCKLYSRADAVRTALAVFEWIQLETQKGRKVMAIGEHDAVPLLLTGITLLNENETSE